MLASTYAANKFTEDRDYGNISSFHGPRQFSLSLWAGEETTLDVIIKNSSG
jgi:hypothetical protein